MIGEKAGQEGRPQRKVKLMTNVMLDFDTASRIEELEAELRDKSKHADDWFAKAEDAKANGDIETLERCFIELSNYLHDVGLAKGQLIALGGNIFGLEA